MGVVCAQVARSLVKLFNGARAGESVPRRAAAGPRGPRETMFAGGGSSRVGWHACHPQRQPP
eukprot:4264206-Pyramimonas_sp.AAC.1